MRTFFIVAGCVWFGLAVVFVLALVVAAGRSVPVPPGLVIRRGVQARESSVEDPAASQESEVAAVIDA